MNERDLFGFLASLCFGWLPK